jgi:uncharacterized protein YaiE (UPF0345 family)
MFENVKLEKKANIYFDGKVSSRTFFLETGERKTLGFMLPGEYEFGTGDAEIMDITAGKLEVLLPDQSEWQTIVGGQTFNVPANASFKVRVCEATDYCCSYIK